MAEETEKLIELVHNYVHLYDSRHADYKDVVKKAECWEEIAEKLNQTSEAVMLNWKNLRDLYVKYLKFLKGTTGSAKSFQKWPWAGHLEFLQDTVSTRPTSSNVSQSTETFHDDGDYNEDVCATDISQMPPPQKKLKPKEVSGDVDIIINYLQNKKKENQVKNNLDRIDHLFLSYAETFKKFSPRTQAILKMEMAQMFGRAELRDLDAQTPPSSSPFSSTNSSWSDYNPYYTDNPPNEVNYSDLQVATH